MTPYLRIPVQATALLASGWLIRDPSSMPVWAIGLALFLATAAIAWMFLRNP